jgi:hypothetical protein
MLNVLSVFLAALSSVFRTHAALQVEILALRHQMGVLQRSARNRQKLTAADRLFWAWLSGVWRDWRSALFIVKPETVIQHKAVGIAPASAHAESHTRAIVERSACQPRSHGYDTRLGESELVITSAVQRQVANRSFVHEGAKGVLSPERT